MANIVAGAYVPSDGNTMLDIRCRVDSLAEALAMEMPAEGMVFFNTARKEDDDEFRGLYVVNELQVEDTPFGPVHKIASGGYQRIAYAIEAPNAGGGHVYLFYTESAETKKATLSVPMGEVHIGGDIQDVFIDGEQVRINGREVTINGKYPITSIDHTGSAGLKDGVLHLPEASVSAGRGLMGLGHLQDLSEASEKAESALTVSSTAREKADQAMAKAIEALANASGSASVLTHIGDFENLDTSIKGEPTYASLSEKTVVGAINACFVQAKNSWAGTLEYLNNALGQILNGAG